MQFKVCSKCKKSLPASSFGKDNRNKSGLRSQCNNCKNATTQLWRANNKERVKQSKRAWDSDNAAHRKEYSKKRSAKVSEWRRIWRPYRDEITTINSTWSDRSVVFAGAIKYKTRKAFLSGSVGAYTAALKGGYLDAVCGHMVCGHTLIEREWTRERVFLLSKDFESRKAFHAAWPSAYQYASKHGIWDDACQHMTEMRGLSRLKWTERELAIEALKYQTKTDMYRSNPSALGAMYKKGLADNLCAHMAPSKNPSNLVYIWEAVNASMDNATVVKIGVSSVCRVKARIKRVAALHGFDCKVLKTIKTDNPFKLEDELLSIGKKFEVDELDGHTEFRILDKIELRQALEVMSGN